MRFIFLIISTVLIGQVANAQNTASITPAQETASTAVPTASTSDTPPVTATIGDSPETDQVAIMDYKSVYEAATTEEEVKMASERFNLTPSQADMWLTAATDRRAVEKQSREKLESKASSYEKDGVYRSLRTAHNSFHESIIGFLSPAQKQALERERLISGEKQRRLAKLPPPPPPAPTVTVAPVDSAAIKETEKAKGKKTKKKKKTVGS